MAPQSSDIFSKERFLMSFQIFLDSIIDLSNEAITLSCHVYCVHSFAVWTLSVMYILAAL